MNKIILICCAFIAAMNVACSESHQTPPQMDGDKEDSKPTPEPTGVKEKMLWFDASANFQRFSSKENIMLFLDKTKETGFNKIVVDVKPVEGDVLYKSSFMTQATLLGTVAVTRDWDYLQFFLDEAHKRDLKVSVSTTIFPMGSPTHKQGPAYRGSQWKGKTCMQYTPQGMIDIKDDPTKVGAFLNPVLPEVQEFALRFIKEIVTNYDFDAYALDYCRFPDYQSDFSAASRSAFESYIGGKVATWPEDIFTYNADGSRNPGRFYKEWWEFRSMVIHDFIARVCTEIKAIKPAIKLEYWAASWWGALYANGQNWASPSFMPLNDTDAGMYSSWCSPRYNKSGFADLLDTFLLGTYLPRVYGPTDGESIEYGINRAHRMLLNSCTYYGTFDVARKGFDAEEAAYYCLKRTAGLMVFDIVHVINNDVWAALKRGIDRAEKEMANK